jgi:hypothetical protein
MMSRVFLGRWLEWHKAMTKVRLREKKVDISTGKIATDFQAREGWRRRLGNLSLVASRGNGRHPDGK